MLLCYFRLKGERRSIVKVHLFVQVCSLLFEIKAVDFILLQLPFYDTNRLGPLLVFSFLCHLKIKIFNLGAKISSFLCENFFMVFLAGDQTYMEMFDLNVPENHIRDSARGYITAIGEFSPLVKLIIITFK